MMDVDFTVGIEGFLCSTLHPCSYCSLQNARFDLSFGVRGDFMQAALRDTLDDTVDYDALCQALAKGLQHASCSDRSALVRTASAIITRFSPQITGGYVAVKILCHEPFIVEQALL